MQHIVLRLASVVGLVMGGCAALPGPERLEPPSGLDTLFLTWADDPTTTIQVQWLEPGGVLPLAPGEPPIVATEVPRAGGEAAVVIDGDLGDWAGAGLAVTLRTDAAGRAPSSSSLAAETRVAWDVRGLLVGVQVTDDAALESAKDDALWEGDGVELFVGVDGGGLCQLIVSPGRDPAHAVMRTQVFDRRKRASASPPAVTLRSTTTDGGYTVEALLPWSELGASGGPEALRLQVYVNDTDAGGTKQKLVWYPSTDSHADASASWRLVPVFGGGWRQTGGGVLDRRPDGSIVVRVIAPLDFSGRVAAVYRGGRALGEAVLVESGGAARGDVVLARPPAGTRWGALQLTVGEEEVGTVPDRPEAWPAPTDPVRVRYRLVGRSSPGTVRTSVVKPFGPNLLHVHRVSLAGLEPDTAYELRVEGDATWHRFRTAPAVLDRPLVFAEGGDIGTEPVVVRLHQTAAAWDPLFGLVGGDLAYADGKHADRWQHYLRDWHTHMRGPDGRLIPMVVTIGNHEVQGGFAWNRLDKAPLYYSLFDAQFPEGSFATLDFGDYLSLVMLDTHTVPVEQQTEWLTSALDARRDMPHVFPLYHVPAYPSVRKEDEGERGKARAAMRAQWVPLFERFGVAVVFEHDDHAYKRTHPLRGGAAAEDGVVYLGDGNWGRGLRDVDATRPYLAKAMRCYNVIRVTLDGPAARFEAFDESGLRLDEHAYPARSPRP